MSRSGSQVQDAIAYLLDTIREMADGMSRGTDQSRRDAMELGYKVLSEFEEDK